MTIHSESLALALASISPAMLALIGGALAALFMLVIVLLLRGASLRREQAEEASFRAEENEARMAELLKIQAEMQGRIAAMTEVFGARQSELNQTISQRLDGMSQRVSSTITEQTKSTHENLQRLQERLAVIDAAQNNIQTLAKDVVGLQAILSNKQTRGAFGQSRMETIVADGLPMGAYAFQQTLSNGSRPDCTIRMPNGAPPLVIDAKFPLEAWNAIRDAGSPEAGKIAGQQFRRDMEVHIRDISEKYLIQGNPGYGLSLRAVRIDLRRNPRALRAGSAEGAPRTHRHRLAVAADAVDPGHPGRAQGSAHAGAGASDPGRSGDPDG